MPEPRRSRAEYLREWRRKNPEKMRAYTDRYRPRVRAWYLEHAEETIRRSLEWGRRNPDRVRIKNHKFRAIREAAEGSWTQQDIDRILEAQDWECYYCHQPLDESYEVDHKQPLRRGGTNWPGNLACACRLCNRRKHALTESEFRAKFHEVKQSAA
jgi:hypothetical protein